jgi:hypothetical protein
MQIYYLNETYIVYGEFFKTEFNVLLPDAQNAIRLLNNVALVMISP